MRVRHFLAIAFAAWFACGAQAQGVSGGPSAIDLSAYATKSSQVCAGDLTGTYPNCNVSTINGGTAIPPVFYASTCNAVINSSTSISTFCAVATDPNSAAKRTYPAGYLVPGKAFRLDGGGVYTVPTGNLLAADITIKVGSSSVMTVTTPAAPVGTNAGVDFHALCTVRTTTTINCNGLFQFVVLGGTQVPVPFNQTSTFAPGPANLIDVLGDWNGTTTTHSTTVTEAVFTPLN